MAIKGKKKSQSRGSQARKRPASAPRPALVARQHVPWYRTPGGRVAVAIAIVVAISAVGGIFVIAGDDTGLEARQRRLQSYTQQVREVRAQITIPASQMANAPMSPRAEGFDELDADGREWFGVLSGAQATAASLQPPAPASATAALFSSSVETYVSAAQMFALAATLEGDAQRQAISLAAAERERALQLWSEGLRGLESERSDAEMDPSGLQPPATASPAPPPAPPAASGDGGNNNADNNDGQKSGGGNKDGGSKN